MTPERSGLEGAGREFSSYLPRTGSATTRPQKEGDNVIILWLKRGHVALEPWKGGQYYPVPVVGPIMAGAFSGCFGGFIHNGLLACVDQGVPW